MSKGARQTPWRDGDLSSCSQSLSVERYAGYSDAVGSEYAASKSHATGKAVPGVAKIPGVGAHLR